MRIASAILGARVRNSRCFFLFLLLELREADEIAHLALRLGRELQELADELAGLRVLRFLGLAEELAHFQIEDLENLEQRVEADLVLPLLHPGEVGLRDPDLLGELRLRQVASLAQFANAGADQMNLARRMGRWHCGSWKMLLHHKLRQL